MIEQINNNLISFAFFSNSLGEGVTGLTVTVDAWRVTISGGVPSTTQILTNQSAQEVGGGLYARVIASSNVNAEGGYLTVFKTTSTSVRDRQLPALWMVNVAGVEYLDGSIISTSNMSAFNSITVQDTEYIPYQSAGDVSLGASVYELTVPLRANAIMVQASGADIYFTRDGATPSSSAGFVLNNGQSWRIIPLDDDFADVPFKFLRSANGAILHYQFLRIK